MQNSKFIQTESVARISEIRSTKSLSKSVVNQNQNQKSELQTRQTGTRQNQNRKQSGVLYYITINWLTQIGTE